MADPKFVRLPERLTVGNVTDMESGWHIGGFDVRVVPDKNENPAAYSFVMSKLRAGILEEASEAEAKCVRNSREEMTRMHLDNLDMGEALDRAGHQESHLQGLGARHRRELLRLRHADPEVEPIPELTQESGKSETKASAASGKAS